MAEKNKKVKGKGGIEEGPVLVAVDLSPHSEAALLYGARLAEKLGLPLIALHVVHDPENLPGYFAGAKKKKTLGRIEDLAGQMFEEFLAGAAERNPDVPGISEARRLLVSGVPVTRILEVSEKQGASTLVVGSRGTTGLSHLLLGSVAERVAHLATIPVTIVK